MNKNQKWMRLKARLERLGRRLAEKLHVGKAPAGKPLDRVDDIAVGLMADRSTRAADSIRKSAQEARKARLKNLAEKLAKDLRRR